MTYSDKFKAKVQAMTKEELEDYAVELDYKLRYKTAEYNCIVEDLEELGIVEWDDDRD